LRGASCGARMSLRGTSLPASNARRAQPREGWSSTGANRLSSGGSCKQVSLPAQTSATPRASTGVALPSVSACTLEAPGSGKASRACVRARSGFAAPGGVRTSARSRQHERSYATLATGHEVGGSETSVLVRRGRFHVSATGRVGACRFSEPPGVACGVTGHLRPRVESLARTTPLRSRGGK